VKYCKTKPCFYLQDNPILIELYKVLVTVTFFVVVGFISLMAIYS